MSQLDRIERKLDSALSQMGVVVKSKEPTKEINFYDEYGVSYEISKYHGVKLRDVEELYQKWIDKGGQHEQVAKTMNHWFCFVRPKKPLAEDVFNQISTNQQNAWIRGWLGAEVVVSEYYHIKGKYQHAVTKKYAFKRPSYFDADYKNWKILNRQQNSIIANHYTVSFGNFSSSDNPNFYSQFVAKIPEAVERIMNGKLASLNDPTRREFPI